MPSLETVVERLEEMREDILQIKEQTTKTNGRVTELEIKARIDTALTAERAARLARESEMRTDQINRQINRRQWIVNTSIATASIVAGVGATLLAAHLG